MVYLWSQKEVLSTATLFRCGRQKFKYHAFVNSIHALKIYGAELTIILEIKKLSMRHYGALQFHLKPAELNLTVHRQQQ